MNSISLDSILTAQNRIKNCIKPTPLTFSERLSTKFKRDIYIKWENKHRTGSFKERGAANLLAQLSLENINQVYTFSAGNHALAVSYHAKQRNIPCTIVMPRYAPLVKVKTTEQYGAKVVLHGDTYDQARSYALDTYGKDSKNFCIPGFDHEDIITGQATCGLEILDQLEDFDSVLVPVGGGGLMAGVASAIKAKKPHVKLIAVQSEWANIQRQGNAQLQNQFQASIADGIAVKQLGVITKSIMDQLVDETYQVTENEIAEAINKLLSYEHVVCEGAGAAALGLLFAERLPAKYKKPVFLMSGSNIDLNLLGRLIDRQMAQADRLLKLKIALPDRPGSLHRLTGIIANANANVLRVIHDRSFCEQPGCVEIGFVLEVQSAEHTEKVLQALRLEGLVPELL